MNCKLCNQEATFAANAVIAPWISKMSSLAIQRFSRLCFCDNCKFYFFDYNFSSRELTSMYAGYRDCEYVSIRKSFEPWYSRKINDAFMSESEDLKSRVDFMTGILTGCGITNLENVVDFGGDEGQFFPHIPIKNKFVVDVSEKTLRDEVKRLANLSELDCALDLIIVAHVLEHVNDPIGLLIEIKQSISKNTYLYIEVPQDFPTIRPFHKTKIYKKFLEFILRHKSIFVAFDFFTGVKRQLKMKFPFFAVVKQSEHINYFSLNSLNFMMKQLNLKVLKFKVDLDSSVGALRLGRLGMVAKLDDSNEVF